MTCTVDEITFIRQTYRYDMHAEDIAENLPVVRADADAIDAVRILADHRLPGLLVTDTSGKPYGVLPAFEILRFVVPGYVRDDLSLAGVLGTSAANDTAQNLAGKTVGDVLPEHLRNVPAAKAGDTVVMLAAEMAQLRSPLIAVTKDGKLHGVITASRLLAAALES